MAAKLNALTNAPIISSPAPGADVNVAGQAQQTTNVTNVEGASFTWGSDPTTRYIMVETTVSGTSYQAPQPGAKGVSKKLANIWPGALYWTENKKQSNSFRLFAKLNAMVMKRNADGIPLLDEEGELTWNEGARFTLCKQGLSKKAQAQIDELESAKSLKPELSAAIDNMIAGIRASAGWVSQTLDSKSFVSSLSGTGEALAPVTMYLNMPFSVKESASFAKAVAKLSAEGKPALLRFYIPVERLAMPRDKWEPVKAKVNNQLVELVHPNTNKVITGPVFSWGNSTQPIAKIELVPGKFLPSSEGMDRVLSVAETDKRIAGMERSWESNEELDMKLWAETLKGRFCSSGNKWAHKAGALPKLNGGVYGTTCDFWQETTESSAKFGQWCEILRGCVGEKPRLHEENLTGSKLFLAETCEAIIAAGAAQSIQPWMDYLSTIGKGNVNVTVAVAPTTPVVASAPAPVKPEVKAIVEEEPSEDDILAAILANRQNLDDLEDEEDITSDFFINVQE